MLIGQDLSHGHSNLAIGWIPPNLMEQEKEKGLINENWGVLSGKKRE